MLMKQLIQKAKIKFFEPDEVSGPAVRRVVSAPEGAVLNRLSAEQQRIQHLENQIQQLRADVARWKNSSLCFAHEVRDLLTD